MSNPNSTPGGGGENSEHSQNQIPSEPQALSAFFVDLYTRHTSADQLPQPPSVTKKTTQHNKDGPLLIVRHGNSDIDPGAVL